jgi:hypothetical protein
MRLNFIDIAKIIATTARVAHGHTNEFALKRRIEKRTCDTDNFLVTVGDDRLNTQMT